VGLFNRNNNSESVAPQPEQYMMSDPGMMSMPMGGMDPRFGGFNSEANASIAQITLDIDQDIEDFKASLKGYKVIKKLNAVTGEESEEKINFGKRFCNDDGINQLVGDLRVGMSKMITLSNVPQKEALTIKKICKQMAMETSLKIAANTREWQVDVTRRSTVTSQMALLMYTNFMRALEGGERTGLLGTIKTINTNVTQGFNQPVKKNILDL